MAFLRSTLISLATIALGLPGCVDAPITPDQLQENGDLRGGSALRAEQAAFSAVEQPPVTQRATQISAVLAEVGSGPLSDRSRFESDVGTVHLHLRADGLSQERPVAFRWTHVESGEAVVVPGTLLPAETLRHVATHTIEPEKTGAWTVEVLAEAPGPDGVASVLWRRDFDVTVAVAEPLQPAALPDSSLH